MFLTKYQVFGSQASERMTTAFVKALEVLPASPATEKTGAVLTQQ